MEIKMKESGYAFESNIAQEITWTVSFFNHIRSLSHEKSKKVKTVQLLIEETSRINPSVRESLPR